MKSFKYLLFGLAALGLSACSSDEPSGSGSTGTEGDVYANLTLSLPTRSQTVTPDDNTNSDNGYEVGSDAENHVAEVLVVLANPTDNSYITCSLSDSRHNPNASVQPTYVVQFQSATLKDYVADEKKSVNVFAFCNPTPALKALFLDSNNEPLTSVSSFVDAVLSIGMNEQGELTNIIWGANKFLMTNAEIVSAEIPQKDVLVKEHDTAAKALPLGTVKVSRASARFDFANTDKGHGANKYLIKDNVSGNPVAYVQMEAMAMFNEATEYYALPRVSANGMDDNSQLCQPEIPTNWVVSPNAAAKAANPFDYSAIKDKYLFPLNLNANADFLENTLASEKYQFALLSDITNGTADNEDDSTWTPEQGTEKGDYFVWRYCTENTIPGTIDNQRKGITTGVVFRGEILPYEEEGADEFAQALKNAMDNGQVVYGYNGVIYGNAADLKAAATKAEGTVFNDNYKAAFGNPANLDESGDLTKSVNGFKIYRPTEVKGQNHYFVYYYYYNRHNNNHNNNQMGIMEFGVVRNNIYKLAVTNVMEFGHTGDPGDDPDPEDPKDPDETEKAYFKVSVRVLPWIVRINNIEF